MELLLGVIQFFSTHSVGTDYVVVASVLLIAVSFAIAAVRSPVNRLSNCVWALIAGITATIFGYALFS